MLLLLHTLMEVLRFKSVINTWLKGRRIMKNMKKTLVCLFFILVLILLVPGVYSYAADAKVTLKPSTKEMTYGNVTVSVSSSISSGSIYKIEWKKGKITKSTSKYWKDSKDITKTSKFSVKKNGWYSVRIIDKNEKIYVRSIKINNIKKIRYHGDMIGYIKSISEKDNKEYTITVDFVEQIKCAKADFWNKSIGDFVKVTGHKGVIVDILSDPRFPDGYAELTNRHNKVDDERYYVVVKFDDFDNYVLANDYNPKGIELGFVLDGAGTYRAYYGISYNSLVEVYTPEEYYVEKGVKMIISKETKVKPAIIDYRIYEVYGDDFRMNGIEYIENIKGKKNTIGDGCITECGYIREVYDEKNKCYTNYVDEIVEKYMS